MRVAIISDQFHKKNVTAGAFTHTIVRYLNFTEVFPFHVAFYFLSTTFQREIFCFLLHLLYLIIVFVVNLKIDQRKTLHLVWCRVQTNLDLKG